MRRKRTDRCSSNVDQSSNSFRKILLILIVSLIVIIITWKAVHIISLIIELKAKASPPPPKSISSATAASKTQGNNDNDMTQPLARKSNPHKRSKRSMPIGNHHPSEPHRRVPVSVLDDLLMDAERSVHETECLLHTLVEVMEEAEAHFRDERGDRPLAQFKEPCETSDDCMQISSYVWTNEETGDACRKSTHLRCNDTLKACLCHDNYELQWDTEVDHDVFQWNPITKTCYVRPGQPCKIDVPCTPGTHCKSSVSFSFNTPPMQNYCECQNITLTIEADDDDWWYCDTYWQRIYSYALDNINRWPVPQPHFSTHFKGTPDSQHEHEDTDEIE